MSASLRPHYRRSRSASAVRFTRPSKPPQSSIYCCKGSTPTGKPRSSPRKSITAFPSGEKLRLDRAQVWGDHCQTISAQIKTLEMEKSQIAKERSQIAESNRIAAIVNQNREAARQHLEQVIESLALLRWHFHQMDGTREAEPVQAGLHDLTDTDVVEPILRSDRFLPDERN